MKLKVISNQIRKQADFSMNGHLEIGQGLARKMKEGLRNLKDLIDSIPENSVDQMTIDEYTEIMPQVTQVKNALYDFFHSL
jgi:hypothetical protein